MPTTDGGLCSPRVSLGQLVDLMLAWSSEDAPDDASPSEGLLQEVTGLDRLSLRALKFRAFAQSAAILEADEPRRKTGTAAYVAKSMAAQGKSPAEIAAWLVEHGLPVPGETTTDRLPTSAPAPEDGGSGSPMAGSASSPSARFSALAESILAEQWRRDFPSRFRALAESILAEHRNDSCSVRGMVSWQSFSGGFDRAQAVLADGSATRREKRMAHDVVALVERAACDAYRLVFGDAVGGPPSSSPRSDPKEPSRDTGSGSPMAGGSASGPGRSSLGDLLPCPFCGSVASFRERAGDGDHDESDQEWVECYGCGARSLECNAEYHGRGLWNDLAAEAWNRRTEET